MINNRQNGRRRGRGGQQARNGQPGGPDRGSRLDNRARGNAAQLLEKYKTLARDAQMQGDRVNTEYYLQFADHYFRVLSENRARFEEQRPRQPNEYRDEFGGEEDGGNANQQRYEAGDDQGGDEGGDDVWENNDRVDPPSERRSYQQREPRQAQNGESYRDTGNRNGGGRDNRENGNRDDNVRDTASRDTASRDSGNRDSGNREAGNRDVGNRESNNRAAPREAGRGRRTPGANVNANANANGFTAPDFLAEPLSPRFELDRAPEPEAIQAVETDSGEVAAPAPKPRRTRRPRGEAAPVEV